MNAAMPRYALAADALRSLTAYLRTLSVAASPGVTDSKVHFALVLQPGTDAEQRRAMVEMLETFFKDRNRGQRAELRRENAGQVHLGRTYHEWVLHVWDLQGASDTWGAQLEHYNQQQAVFALVSGLGKRELAADPRVQRALRTALHPAAGRRAGRGGAGLLHRLSLAGHHARSAVAGKVSQGR